MTEGVHRRRGRAGIGVWLALAAGVALAGCAASTPAEPTSRWVPAADARFVTLDRSTSVVLVPAGARDVLMYEEPVPGGGTARWVLSVPARGPLSTPVEVGGEGPARGWLVEMPADAGSATHATEVTGRVVFHSRSADTVNASVRLVAESSTSATPGVLLPDRPALARRLVWERRALPVIRTPEMATRSGEPAGSER